MRSIVNYLSTGVLPGSHPACTLPTGQVISPAFPRRKQSWSKADKHRLSNLFIDLPRSSTRNLNIFKPLNSVRVKHIVIPMLSCSISGTDAWERNYTVVISASGFLSFTADFI